MAVHYHNRRPAPDPDARYWPDLDLMLPEMDVMSLNAPYGPDTHHLIDRRRLGLMRDDFWLINAARGGLVEEEALIEALAAGRIAGAALDVYPNEPQVDPEAARAPQPRPPPPPRLGDLGEPNRDGREGSGEHHRLRRGSGAAGPGRIGRRDDQSPVRIRSTSCFTVGTKPFE